VDAEGLREEQARVRCELLEVRHRLRVREENHRQEADFWRETALQMALQLAEGALSCEYGGDGASIIGGSAGPGPGAAASVGGGAGACDASAWGADESTAAAEVLAVRRAQREEAETRLGVLLAQKRAAGERVACCAELTQRLREDLSREAVSLLTRGRGGETGAAARTFVRSLPRLDDETLRWVRSEILAHKRGYHPAEPRLPPPRGPVPLTPLTPSVSMGPLPPTLPLSSGVAGGGSSAPTTRPELTTPRASAISFSAEGEQQGRRRTRRRGGTSTGNSGYCSAGGDGHSGCANAVVGSHGSYANTGGGTRNGSGRSNRWAGWGQRPKADGASWRDAGAGQQW